MKERVIKKVTVNVGGLKGLILEGTQEIIKENKISIDSFKDGKKRPIHLDLENKIEELRFFALDICGLITESTRKDEKNSLLSGCDVLSFDFELGDTGYFRIKVASRVFDTKTITLSTPKVDSSDGYEYFDTVMKIIEAILEEIKHFVDETKVISDAELNINYIRHGKGVNVDMEAYNEMTEEEKADFHQEALGKLGYLVNTLHISDISEDDDVVEDVVTETVINSNEINFEEPVTLGISHDNPPMQLDLSIAEPILLKK